MSESSSGKAVMWFVDVGEFDYEIQFGRITGGALYGPGRTIMSGSIVVK